MVYNRFSNMERFRFFLEDQGKQLTTERQLIAEVVFEGNLPTSWDHLGEFVVQRFTHQDNTRRISRSTIYRTLEHLQQAGLINKP